MLQIIPAPLLAKSSEYTIDCPDLTVRAWARIEELVRTLRPDRARILLSHIPLYRPIHSTECGAHRRGLVEFAPNKTGESFRNTLTADVTVQLLTLVQPDFVIRYVSYRHLDAGWCLPIRTHLNLKWLWVGFHETFVSIMTSLILHPHS